MGRAAIPGLAAARAKPQFRRSGREQALVETVQFAEDHPWPVAFISAAFGGALGALVIVDDGPLVRVAAGALGAAAAVALVFLVVYGLFWLGAPRRQRDQARERLSEVDRKRRLLILNAHLEGIREVLHRNIEQETHKHFSGRIPDGTTSWLEGENEELKEKLVALGLPELIPELTLDDPERLRTWEGVRQAERDLHARWYAALFSDQRLRGGPNSERRLDED